MLVGRGNLSETISLRSPDAMLSRAQTEFHMVARTASTGSSGKLSTDISVLGGKLPKWTPRAGLDGHPTWVDAIEDAAAQLGLMPILECTRGAPTIREVSARYAGRSLDADELLAILEQCLLQWTEMATAFYFLVRPTLVLTGEHEKDDLEIVSTFRCGGDRDGWGLWQWLKAFSDCSSHEAQATLRQTIDAAKLGATSNLDQLELHAKEMLRNWKAIDLNNISEPASFYHQLLHSIQVVPSAPTLLNDVRKWLITSMEDTTTELYRTPSMMVARMIVYAKLIGLPHSQAALMAINRPGETRQRMRNDCLGCDMSTCDSEKRGGIAKCRMLHKTNRSKTWLSLLTDGQNVYLKAGDDHLLANPDLKSLKGVKLTMPPRPASGGRGRPTGRGKQLTAIIAQQGSSTEATDAQMFRDFVDSRACDTDTVLPVLGLVENQVQWQLDHAEDWNRPQRPDTPCYDDYEPVGDGILAPGKILTIDIKRPCRGINVIGYSSMTTPTTCLLDLLGPDVLGMIARSVSDYDYGYWNPTPSVLATRVACRVLKSAIDMHAAVQYYGRVGPWIHAMAQSARWDAERQRQLDIEWGSSDLCLAEQYEAIHTFRLWMWVRAGDWDEDLSDSDSESDQDSSESEHEDDVRRSSDWDSDSED